MLMRQGEDGDEQTSMVLVIQQLGPGFGMQLQPTDKTQRPIIAMDKALFVIE